MELRRDIFDHFLKICSKRTSSFLGFVRFSGNFLSCLKTSLAKSVLMNIIKRLGCVEFLI